MEARPLKRRATDDPGDDDETSPPKLQLPKEVSDMFGPQECRLCDVKVESNIAALTHYKGKLHEKKLRAYLAERDIPYWCPEKKAKKAPGLCQVCSVVLTSEIQARQHYAGKAHLKNLSRGNSAPKIQVPTLPSQPPPPEFYCHLCNVPTTSAEQLQNHKKGAKHLKRIKKTSGPDCDPRRDLSMYRTPSDQYYCPRCNITSNSSEQFIQHIDSKRHKRNARIKVQDSNSV